MYTCFTKRTLNVPASFNSERRKNIQSCPCCNSIEKYQQINKKNEGSDSNLIDSSFGHHSLRSSFRVQGHLWSCAWEAEPENDIKSGLNLRWKMYFLHALILSQKENVGKSSNHAKLPFGEIYEISIRISRFDFRAVAPDSKCMFLFISSI